MMRPLMVVAVLLALSCTAFAADNLSFSLMTSTGKIPVNGMASYKVVEKGDLSGWVDLMYLGGEDSLALGVSARHVKLVDIIPLVNGGGFCAYWSFRHECVKGRFYLVNVTF